MMCADCRKKREFKPDQWFSHIWYLYSKRMAGYPYEKNDLKEAEWLALSEMISAVDSIKQGMI
jgi:hypothetical protein